VLTPKTFLHFIRWAGLVCGTWYKIVSDRTGVRRGANARFPSLEIVIENQKFLENPEVGILNFFFAGMKLTLHKSQVHSYSAM